MPKPQIDKRILIKEGLIDHELMMKDIWDDGLDDSQFYDDGDQYNYVKDDDWWIEYDDDDDDDGYSPYIEFEDESVDMLEFLEFLHNMDWGTHE